MSQHFCRSLQAILSRSVFVFIHFFYWAFVYNSLQLNCKCYTLLILYPFLGVSCCCIRWEIRFYIIFSYIQRVFFSGFFVCGVAQVQIVRSNSWNLRGYRLSYQTEYIIIRLLTGWHILNKLFTLNVSCQCNQNREVKWSLNFSKTAPSVSRAPKNEIEN